MKTVLKIVGGLIALLLVAIVVIPFVVNVDKYRPMIVSKANEMINGKLEIGQLSLSLWGKIKIGIDGVKLTDPKGKTVLSVKDADVTIPVSSLLSGSPEMRLDLVQPEIMVIKNREGKMNVMSLMKEQPKSDAAAQGAGTAQTQAAGGAQAGMPEIVLKSRFTFLLSKAKVNYLDEFTGDKYDINDLSFSLKDVSLTREMPFEISANLDMIAQKTIKVAGPLLIDGSLKALTANGAFEKLDVKLNFKMDGMTIKDADLFDKKPGVPLGFNMVAQMGKDFADIPTMKFNLAQVVVDSEVKTKTSGEMTNLDFKLKTNKIEIAKLGDLISMIKQYGMNGEVQLGCEARGPLNKIDYAANVKFDKMKLSNESLKQPIEVNGSVEVVTNKLKDLTVRLSAKDFDVNVKGMLENFLKPNFSFKLTSNMMNLDELLKSMDQAKDERAKAADAQTAAGGAASTSAPKTDFNAMFKPLRENPMAAATQGKFEFDIKKIKTTGIVIDDFKGAYTMNNLVMGIKDFSMRIFNGSIKSNMSINAQKPKPEVGANLTVAGLDTKKMVESKMPFARNTMKGIVSANMNIGGPGINPDDVTKDWKGSGQFDFKDAKFSSMDFGPQIKNNVQGKLPAMVKDKVKIPDSLANWDGDYQSMVVKFALDKGVFFINAIDGKANPHRGMDTKGGGTIHLSDYALDLNLDLIDTYNLMNLDGTAKDKRYGHFTLSPSVKGTMFSPKFDWEKTVGNLARNAAEGKGKEMLQKVVNDKLGGKLPPAAQNQFKKLMGGGDGGQQGDNSAPPVQAPKAEEVKNKLKGLFGR